MVLCNGSGTDIRTGIGTYKLGLEIRYRHLIVMRHDFFFYNDACTVLDTGIGLTLGRVDSFNLNGLHFQMGTFLQINFRGGIHHTLSGSFSRTVMLFHILYLGILSDMEGMNSGMFRFLISRIVNSTPCNDYDITVLSDKELVINHFLKSRLCDENGNMNALVLCSRLNDDIDSGLVGLRYDINICRCISSEHSTVGTNIIRTGRNLMKICDILQKSLLNCC